MEELSLSQLRQLVYDGYVIVWTGSLSDYMICIRLRKDKKDYFYTFDVSMLPVPKKPKIVKHIEATAKPLSFVGPTWQRRGWLRSIRLASIFGINVYGSCYPGMGKIPNEPKDVCSMGYDIEVSMSLVKTGGFVPPYSRITSIAVWCTCGYCEAWTTIKIRQLPYLTYRKRSSEIVDLFIEMVQKHIPQWLVGYNNYQFDNCSMLWHASRKYKTLFRAINSGAKSVSRNAFMIDITGVNNVDLYSYLDKVLRSKYKALGLGDVAKQEGIGGKTQMPVTDSEDTVYQLVSYNINDSKITALLWNKTGTCTRVSRLCLVSCAPVVDCVRVVTGTMVACHFSSYLISKGMLMDWSQCDLRIGYEGGTVLEPIKGVMKNVIVCDFSSMYPTIIRDIGISPENIEIISDCSENHEDKIIYWNKRCVLACIKGKIIRYSIISECVSRTILTDIVESRTKYKKSDPAYADSLKLMNNSLYGAFGFAASPLHSPRCAATVTVAGRTALALAYTVFTGLGLTVGYGDTDSCFLGSGKYTKLYFDGNEDKHTDAALSIFHKILKYTPFPSMKMEKERKHKAVLLIDKKHYAYADFDGQVHTKGLSSTRKDRLGICRDMTTYVAEQILLQDDIEEARKVIITLLNAAYSTAHAGGLDMYLVSKEVRFEGNSCYRFTDTMGNEINVPVTRADRASYVPYDYRKVLSTLERDMNKLCIPAGLGTVSNMLMEAEL